MNKISTRIALLLLPLILLGGAASFLVSERAFERSFLSFSADRMLAPRIDSIRAFALRQNCFSAQCLAALRIPVEKGLTLFDDQGRRVAAGSDRPAPYVNPATAAPGVSIDGRFFWVRRFAIEDAPDAPGLVAMFEDADPPDAALRRVRAAHGLATGIAFFALWIAAVFSLRRFADRPIDAALSAGSALGADVNDLRDLPAALSKAVTQKLWLSEREGQSEERLRDVVMNVSHDLRTPVASLRASIDLLKKGGLSDQSAGRLLSTVSDQAAVLSRMIDDLFEIAKYESGVKKATREPVGVAELVGRVAAAFEAACSEKGIRLENHCDDCDAEIHGDGEALRRMLANIVENAVAQCRPDDSIALSCKKEENGVLIYVRDTGPGLPVADPEKLFERYYRGAGGGAGIGLALSARIAESHKGQIAAKSTGDGAQFTIWMPFEKS